MFLNRPLVGATKGARTQRRDVTVWFQNPQPIISPAVDALETSRLVLIALLMVICFLFKLISLFAKKDDDKCCGLHCRTQIRNPNFMATLF